MPDIFTTGTKFKLVEYGSSSHHGFNGIRDIKDTLVKMLRRLRQK